MPHEQYNVIVGLILEVIIPVTHLYVSKILE